MLPGPSASTLQKKDKPARQQTHVSVGEAIGANVNDPTSKTTRSMLTPLPLSLSLSDSTMLPVSGAASAGERPRIYLG